MTINKIFCQLVRERAKAFCEYCHSPEWSSADLFRLEHLRPQSLGGANELNNLALACRRYNFTTGIDSETGLETQLFQPRQQLWADLALSKLNCSKISAGISSTLVSFRIASGEVLLSSNIILASSSQSD